ncbi:MAG: NADH-quinone oxidoreductase subunit J [Anaerolineales bacterium]
MGFITAAALGLAFLCAVLSIRADRLLTSAIWLAAVSALLSISFYLLNAPYLAVLELSIGAGLVTVLFVFAISIAGEADVNRPSLFSPWLALPILAFIGGLTAYWLVPGFSPGQAIASDSFSQALWEQRGLDTALQALLILAGGLGVLHILSEPAVESDGEKSAGEAATDPEIRPTELERPRQGAN